MGRRRVRFFALVALLGCAPLATIGQRTPFASICSPTSAYGYRVQLMLADDAGHRRWVGNVDPGQQLCDVYDLPGDRGRWGFLVPAPRDRVDTLWTPYFWAAGLR